MIGDFIIEIVNYIIAGVGVVLGWIVALFPDSPFPEPAEPPEMVNLGWITWLIDFPTMVVHTFYLTLAIGLYYAIRVLARWIKLARG